MSFDAAALRAALRGRTRVARVVVAQVAGSAPREPGAAMLVWDGGQSGTIGGGALELQAAAAARSLLAKGGAAVTRHPLGPALGQCCGGSVTLVTEVFDAATLKRIPDGSYLRRVTGDAPPPLALSRAIRQARGEGIAPAVMLSGGWLLEPAAMPSQAIWVWGAGHVGRALVGVLSPLPHLALTWVDTAPERFPEGLPEGVTVVPTAAPATLAVHAPRDAHHLILTYSHALDLALCAAVLTRGFASAGVIGSATKWARFRTRLAALGHDPAEIASITCPIGDPSLGKHPQAIALGVAAALLKTAGAQSISKGCTA